MEHITPIQWLVMLVLYGSVLSLRIQALNIHGVCGGYYSDYIIFGCEICIVSKWFSCFTGNPQIWKIYITNRELLTLLFIVSFFFLSLFYYNERSNKGTLKKKILLFFPKAIININDQHFTKFFFSSFLRSFLF